jgi:hypothetical protein
MTVFEYAGGLISIVVGLAIARVLGGIGIFIRAKNRSPSDWLIAAWCLALVFNMAGWWFAGWAMFSEKTEIGVGTLLVWLVATSLFYLAAYVLMPNTGLLSDSGAQARLAPIPAAFYLCMAAHFGVGIGLAINVTGRGMTTTSIATASMAVVSAAGAAAKSNQARGWLLVFTIGGQAIGVRP